MQDIDLETGIGHNLVCGCTWKLWHLASNLGTWFFNTW